MVSDGLHRQTANPAKGRNMNQLNVDPHTKVSNEAEATGTLMDIVGLEPEPGEGPSGVAPSVIEEVPGYEQPGEQGVQASLKAAFDEDLPDIGQASFGPLPDTGVKTVIEEDDRVRISPASSYPWRVHASLLITARDGSRWIGTGWFVGPHTLITAGHCMHIKNSGIPARDGWVRSIEVSPGRDADSFPYGTVTSTQFRSVTGWTQDGNPDYDYGAIILGSDLGSTTGWLGAANYSDATLTSSTGNLAGYPGDKPAGTLWYHARKISSVSPLKVYYDIDTFGGQSGSAVYVIKDGGRYAVAVHAYGGSLNSGTRISASVLQNIVSWRA